MMENYFYNTSRDYYKGIISEDFKPESNYQYGATPEYIEKARDHEERFLTYPAEDKPDSKFPPVYDSKWRFFWVIGERDAASDEGMLMYPNWCPRGYAEWENIMNTWGYKMLNGCEVVAQMAAIGLGLKENSLLDRMKFAGHLLAPTGSDLGKFRVGDVFAGVHYGKST